MNKPPLSDEKLMQQVAAGNADALAQLAARYQDIALSLAFRNTQNWTDAEDIAQEAFIRVFKAAGRYKGHSGFKTWLYRIVVNLCMDHHRRTKSNISLEAIDTDVPAETDPDTLQAAETAQIVQKAVNELPERQKIVLLLHRYEDLTHAQISDATGWTPSAVESLLVRAYGNLRQKLGKFKNNLE